MLFECFPLGTLVLDAGDHQGVLVGVGMLGVLGEELFDRDERELLVFVTIRCLVSVQNPSSYPPTLLFRAAQTYS